MNESEKRHWWEIGPRQSQVDHHPWRTPSASHTSQIAVQANAVVCRSPQRKKDGTPWQKEHYRHMDNCHGRKKRTIIKQQGKAILCSWLCSFPETGTKLRLKRGRWCKGWVREGWKIRRSVDMQGLYYLGLTDACHFCFFIFVLTLSFWIFCWWGTCFPSIIEGVGLSLLHTV